MAEEASLAESDAIGTLMSRVTNGRLVAPAPNPVELRTILTAAVRAPDHGRLKPWRFFAVRGPALARLGDVMADALSRRIPGATEEQVRREREKPLRAPMVLVAAARVRADTHIPAVEQILAVGAAVQNVLLAAGALGFGSAWKTGDAAYDEHVKAAFGLRPADAIVGFIYLGQPERPQPRPTSSDVSEVLSEWTA
ncbi:MAG TPA: nitroreductase [Ramlibacter sp.]|nr:nitroreductase [Ramlibacter sp.]